jgi:hypothetical protein
MSALRWLGSWCNGKLWHSDGAMRICRQVPRSFSAREELLSRQHRAGGVHKIGPTAVTGNFRGRSARETFRHPATLVNGVLNIKTSSLEPE